MVVESKGWNWGVVKGGRAEYWRAPSREAYYLVQRWMDLGLRDFLDLGCGLGRHAILFGKSGFRVSCFDFSEEALEKTEKWAQDEGLSFDYKAGDMLELPYADDSFDAILCYLVINHTDTTGVRKVLSEIRRVLRPGGECYFTLGSKNAWGWKETDWPLVDENTKLRMEEGPEYKVPHFYADYDALKELVADFEVIDIRQVEEFRQKPGETRVFESWSYHTLVRKVEQNF